MQVFNTAVAIERDNSFIVLLDHSEPCVVNKVALTREAAVQLCRDLREKLGDDVLTQREVGKADVQRLHDAVKPYVGEHYG